MQNGFVRCCFYFCKLFTHTRWHTLCVCFVLITYSIRILSISDWTRIAFFRKTYTDIESRSHHHVRKCFLYIYIYQFRRRQWMMFKINRMAFGEAIKWIFTHFISNYNRFTDFIIQIKNQSLFLAIFRSLFLLQTINRIHPSENVMSELPNGDWISVFEI